MRSWRILRSTACDGPVWELQDPKGKGKCRDDVRAPGTLALDVPLELLGKPICKRSSAHLEASLHVIEVSLGRLRRTHMHHLLPVIAQVRLLCAAWLAVQLWV